MPLFHYDILPLERKMPYCYDVQREVLASKELAQKVLTWRGEGIPTSVPRAKLL
jgi:hypothetical protein